MTSQSEAGYRTVGDMRRRHPPPSVTYFDDKELNVSGESFLDSMLYRPTRMLVDRYSQIVSPLALNGAFSKVSLNAQIEIDLVHLIHHRGLSRYDREYIVEIDQPITDWLTRYHGTPREKLKLIVHVIRKILSNKTFRGFITWSQRAKLRILSEYLVEDDRIKVIPPAICTSGPPPPKDTVRILFIGYDFLRKGGDLVLMAFRRLSQTAGRKIHLTYIGSVPVDYRHLLNSSNIDYFHRVPHQLLLSDILPLCDIFILPSRVDCYPIALLEAMSNGLAVIAGSDYAIPEIVEHGVNGFLLEKLTAAEVENAIVPFIEDSSLRTKFGNRAFQTIAFRHDPIRIAQQLRVAYDDLLC